MSRINTNVEALRAVHQLRGNRLDLNLRLERLATGLRINRGADDPAGLIASEGLRAEIRAIEQAIDNSTRAINVISTAEGSLTEVSALLLQLQDLLVESANDGALTDEEILANQLEIDSILGSIDRIANTTTFAGNKLLDGSGAYNTSSIQPSAIASLNVFSARLPNSGIRTVNVEVTNSAETARVGFVGTQVNGANQSITSAATVEVRGVKGSDLLSFASGATLADIRTAVNDTSHITGVSAVISSTGVAGVQSAVVLHSVEYGSDQFVSVTPIAGNFVEANNNSVEIRDDGVDVGVVVNGQLAASRGLQADVRSEALDTRLFLTASFAESLSSTQFVITGGGSLFQLSPRVTPNGQENIGFERVASTALGNGVVGLLYSLRSGQINDLKSKNFSTAQNIVDEAINQVSSYRGRLGNFQKNKLEPNISSHSIALENVKASESIIRDADIAEEVTALTRAQILVQSTQTTLQIASTAPQAVLQLLG
ncbi:MAG: flagellin N-terminal helical domain-containing protein [Planctomycetota bacterium]|jgi:flagellin